MNLSEMETCLMSAYYFAIFRSIELSKMYDENCILNYWNKSTKIKGLSSTLTYFNVYIWYTIGIPSVLAQLDNSATPLSFSSYENRHFKFKCFNSSAEPLAQSKPNLVQIQIVQTLGSCLFILFLS